MGELLIPAGLRPELRPEKSVQSPCPSIDWCSFPGNLELMDQTPSFVLAMVI